MNTCVEYYIHIPHSQQTLTMNRGKMYQHKWKSLGLHIINPPKNEKTRLPKLSIPILSGNTLQWQSFWNCFEAAVHHNPSITKGTYLCAQLQGNALQVIAGLTLTNANYNHSVSLLKERYGELHKFVDAHTLAGVN